MPFYEYECADCGQRVEVLQQIGDEPLSRCPTCEAQSLRRLVSAAGFRLKGSGWYATDFKNKGTQAGDKGEDKTEKAAPSKEETESGSSASREAERQSKPALKEETGSGAGTSASAESKSPTTTAD